MANFENAVATTSTNEAALTDVQRAAVIAHYEAFRLPEAADSEFSIEELYEDMEGIHLSLTRIKIPSGGGLFFEIPGENPDDPEAAKTLEGIIVHSHDAQAYWESGKEDGDENVPPNCSSVDGINGIGNPGSACALCPMNAWGSADKGKGKACKNMRHLYLLRNGDFLPTLISLPPTSLKPYNDFVSSEFVARRRAVYGSIIQIGLRKENNGKDDYSVATFKKLYDFSGVKLAEVRRYVGEVKTQIKTMLAQQAVEAETRTFVTNEGDNALVDIEFSNVAAQLANVSVAGDLPM